MSEFDYEKGREEFQHARVKVKELEAHESCPCRRCVALGFRKGEATTRARFAVLTEAARSALALLSQFAVPHKPEIVGVVAKLRDALGGKMTTIEHGPETACYSNEGMGRPTCLLICLCGKCFRAQSWEEVGADFDEHLEETEEVVS